MGMFSGIGSATVGGGGVYHLAGLYRVKIGLCKMQRSTQGKGDQCILEQEIVRSNNPLRPVGMKVSHVISLRHLSALGNVKNFISAANGIEGDDVEGMKQVDEQVTELCFSSTQPLAGIEVDLQCTDTMTRANTPFTLHRYSPAKD